MKASFTAATLDPKILGFWTRCLRETTHISQDALAAASGLDVRTIQRIENGNSVNLTTRRCLARGLGYANQDAFDDPEFIANVTSLLKGITDKQLEEQHPDCIRVKAKRVTSGDMLSHFADTSNAMMLHADEGLPPEAKETAAALFDFVRDMMDLGETSYADKLTFNESLEDLRKELEERDTALYSAFRPVRISNETWSDRSPLSFMVGYLTVVPRSVEVGEMVVPKRVQLG